MLDIKLIRKDPEKVRQALARLRVETPLDEILSIDNRRREMLVRVEDLKALRNKVSKEISTEKDTAVRQQKIVSMRTVGDQIAEIDLELKALDETQQRLMIEIPNLPHHSVPDGDTEADNQVIRTTGSKREFDFEPKPHWELGAKLDIIDFERGIKVSGSRFYILKGMGARLQRALIRLMLDIHTSEHGFTEIYPPYMVRRDCMFGTGQLPKFGDNLYIDQEDDFFFIPTAEVPVTNMHMDEIFEPGSLPRRYVAYTACFRREKMSAGRDVRGIKRGHQFDKVEMVEFVEPENSYQELESLTGFAEKICMRLGVPHRVVDICAGDLSFTAAKKYDVEMWAPGCGEWLEVSSCSNFESFQARRMNIRYRKDDKSKPEFVHTLNGSGLALPRVLIAVLENFQNADGSISLPDALIPYMDGVRTVA